MKTQKIISILCLTALCGLFFSSCNSKQNPSDSTATDDSATMVVDEQQSTAPQITIADIVGTYESIGEDGNIESRLSIFEDGTASWNMLGSLVISEYTYTIQGNKIFMTNKEFPDEEPSYWEFDPETHFLKDSQGIPTYYPESVD